MKHKYIISNIETNMLIKMKENGNKEARNELIKYHLFLVPEIAANYNDGTCDINDLIQSGYEGLIRAVNKYTFSASNSFKEFLNFYINYYIKKCYKKTNSKPVLINIKDCQNTPADISIEEDYLKKEEKEKLYKCIFEAKLTPKQLWAINEAFDLGLPTDEKIKLPRNSKHEHKVAALSKIKKTNN